MSTATLIIIILIVLHLIVGFGWLVYKLSPRKKDNSPSTTDKDPAENPESN